MIRRLPWRAGLLALAVLVAGTGNALAHALPGSVISLRQQGVELQLTIRFPVEDLIIAAPELAGLAEVVPGQPLPRRMTRDVTRYLGRHLALTQSGAPLGLTLAEAHVQPAYHEHIGNFASLVSQWSIQIPETQPGTLLLEYDAVMHEVRNHRATVQWLGQDGIARQIAEFGYFSAAKGIPLDRGPADQK